jgi:hypothetical protein
MAGDRELKVMESTLATLRSLDAEARQRVLVWLEAKLGLNAGRLDGEGKDPDARDRTRQLGTIKEFLKQKAPTDDVARVTALAYFVTHGNKLATYKINQLAKARIDAALTKLNMSRAVANAKRAGYVTTAAEHGTYQITSTGESLVDAMPDTEAVQRVRALGNKRRRKSTRSNPATRKKPDSDKP